jgi:hypothetical protein
MHRNGREATRERTSASQACGSTPFIFAETMRLYVASARWPSSNCAVFRLIQLRSRPRPQRLEDLSGRMSSRRSSAPSPRVLPGCRFA